MDIFSVYLWIAMLKTHRLECLFITDKFKTKSTPSFYVLIGQKWWGGEMHTTSPSHEDLNCVSLVSAAFVKARNSSTKNVLEKIENILWKLKK